MEHCDRNGLRRPVELICWAARANTVKMLGPSHSRGLGSGSRLRLLGSGLGCQEFRGSRTLGLRFCMLNFPAEADNTVRENKNRTVLGYLMHLAASKAFRVTNLTSSRVGHTHNRLDALFGLLSTAVRYEDSLLDMEDTCRKLD